VTSGVANAATLVRFRGTAVDTHYLAKPGGGSFAVEIDNQQKKISDTSAASRICKKVTISGLSGSGLEVAKKRPTSYGTGFSIKID